MQPKILIVDDEPFSVEYLEQELAELGYRTISATNGAEALARAAAEPPDLILLDICLPKADGFIVCQQFKDNTATQLVPVIIMTALTTKEDCLHGVEAGADDFLSKPVDPQLLRAHSHRNQRETNGGA